MELRLTIRSYIYSLMLRSRTGISVRFLILACNLTAMKKIILFMLIVFLGFALADAGPGPVAPSITLKFIQDGKAYSGGVDASYICDIPDNSTGVSPVSGREMNLTCTNGVCRNDAWFYKFNPCFYSESGHLKYDISGKDGVGRTGNMNFSTADFYEVTVNLDDNSVTKKTSKNWAHEVCPFVFIAFAVPGLLYMRSRTWN